MAGEGCVRRGDLVCCRIGWIALVRAQLDGATVHGDDRSLVVVETEAHAAGRREDGRGESSHQEDRQVALAPEQETSIVSTRLLNA